MSFNLKIYSKKLIHINNFIKLVKFVKKKMKFKIYIYQQQNVTLIKKFTVLRSPHVNKTSQEQFEYRTHRKRLKIFSYDLAKCLYILKEIKKKMFAGIKMKIELNSFSHQKFIKRKLKLNNFNFAVVRKKLNKKTESFLRLLDIYGEMHFTDTNN